MEPVQILIGVDKLFQYTFSTRQISLVSHAYQGFRRLQGMDNNVKCTTVNHFPLCQLS